MVNGGLFDGLLPPRDRRLRGLGIAAVLWILFMVATTYTSAVTLLDRVASTDVMRAASAGAWTSRIAWEVNAFVARRSCCMSPSQALTWILAVATAIVYPIARIKFGRIVTGWFCVLAGAVLAYNALWYPRTLIGAYYHDAVATPIGPFHVGQIGYLAAFALCVLMLLACSLKLIQQADPVVRRRSLAWRLSRHCPRRSPALAVDRVGNATAAASVARTSSFGIDSLRLEQLHRFGGTGVTPNLDRFLAEGGPVLRHHDARGANFLVVDCDPDRPCADRDRSSFQPRRAIECQGQPDDCRRTEAGWLPHRLLDGRSPVREHRRVLRLRPGDHAAHRRLRLPYRHLQRVAACVAGHQHANREVAFSVFVCQSWRRHDVSAGNLRRAAGPRSVLR